MEKQFYNNFCSKIQKYSTPNLWCVIFTRFDGNYLPDSHTKMIGVYNSFDEAMKIALQELCLVFEMNFGCVFFNHPSYKTFKNGDIDNVQFHVEDEIECTKDTLYNPEYDENTIKVYRDQNKTNNKITFGIIENQCDNLNKWNEWEWNVYKILF